MRYIILTIFFAVLSCEKFIPDPGYNAEIIAWEGRKCYCKYGWLIVYKNDTILSKSVIIGNTIGYNAKLPVKVYIQAEYDAACLQYDYYTVKKILWTH